MATKKKKVWPKIKLVKGTATQIREGMGITEEDQRRVEAILREVGAIGQKPSSAKKRPVSARTKSAAAK